MNKFKLMPPAEFIAPPKFSSQKSLGNGDAHKFHIRLICPRLRRRGFAALYFVGRKAMELNMLIINAEIFTMDGGLHYKNGFISVKDGKIFDLGDMSDSPFDDDVIDAKGGCVTPGLIDAHCHLGVFGDSQSLQSSDESERNNPITPHLRIIDSVNPLDRYFAEARAGGVTTVVVSPGSTNVLGGQTAVISTSGKRIDDMIIKSPCSLKCAFGDNPKTEHGGKGRSPQTRMATAAMLRQALYSAMDYGQRLADIEREKPPLDLVSEALLMLLDNRIPLHAHAHRADDIFTAIRIAEEFGIELKIVHATEGHLIADELAKEKIDVMVGPALCARTKPELYNLAFDNAAVLERAGVRLAIITDHPEIPINHLLLCAQLAVKGGMSREGALSAITCDAAAIIGVDERLGKIHKNYDADLVVFNKNPLDFDAEVLYTISKGEKMYKK
ncbi:MAG: imidazolonepropionase [Firmicutes bacterium ADurb.Bin193]|nr:MAG: imidazolonepropionase [Firmicutes bacterium ADurb.Bin193]